ncbi:PLP-dependent transferase, partial [Lentinula aciculospora]
MSLSFKLSKTILSTISPPIPAAYKWTPKTPKYVEVLDMSQGIPGTPPHSFLQQSFREMSSRTDAWGYCPAEGEQSLRVALANEMKGIYRRRAYSISESDGDEGVDITSDDIAITSGCNLAFVATIMAIADAGDEVILPVPWYFNHQMTLTLLGISPVPLPTYSDSSFLPSPAIASTLITPKTRAIAFVTPNNPTGAVYPPALIKEFANLASEKGVALILDETYRDFIVEGRAPHGLFSSSVSLSSNPTFQSTWRSTLISLYSFSKSYRIPGHRLGAITASPELLKEIGKVLDTLQICAPRVPQLALASSSSLSPNSRSAQTVSPQMPWNFGPTPPSTSPSTPGERAEPGLEESISPPNLAEFAESKSVLSALRPDIVSTSLSLHARHRLFKSTLEKEAPRWTVGSQGAYYAFVRHPFPNHSSEEVCRKLVEDAGVRALPGSFFFGGEVTSGKPRTVSPVFSGF